MSMLGIPNPIRKYLYWDGSLVAAHKSLCQSIVCLDIIMLYIFYIYIYIMLYIILCYIYFLFNLKYFMQLISSSDINSIVRTSSSAKLNVFGKLEYATISKYIAVRMLDQMHWRQMCRYICIGNAKQCPIFGQSSMLPLGAVNSHCLAAPSPKPLAWFD